MLSSDKQYPLLDHVPMGAFVLSAGFGVLYWNRCIEEWSGIKRGDIIGRPLFDLFPQLRSPRYLSRIEQIFRGGPPTVFSSQLHPHFLPCPLPGGRLRVQYTVATGIPNGDGSHDALFSIQDVTALTQAIDIQKREHARLLVEMEERRKAEETLQKYAAELKRLNEALAERAVRDGLTGLYNHRYFYEMLRRDFLLASRHNSDISCLIADLDFFKRVNDSHGHLIGDRILKGVAKRLAEAVRETDIVARYGGEEFAVLLPNTCAEGAVILAENVRRSIGGHPFRVGGISVTVTASIGVASLRTHLPPAPKALVEMADRALYNAKVEGRDCVKIYHPAMALPTAVSV